MALAGVLGAVRDKSAKTLADAAAQPLPDALAPQKKCGYCGADYDPTDYAEENIHGDGTCLTIAKEGEVQDDAKDTKSVLHFPKDWHCVQHARKAVKRKIPPGVLLTAMLEVLFDSERFARRCGWTPEGGKISLDAVNEQLPRLGPICCFLSNPERQRAFELAANPAELERKQKARTGIMDRKPE